MSAIGTGRPPAEHPDARPLTRALTGGRAVAAFEPLTAPCGPLLELDARGLLRADAYTGVVTRAAAERHLAADAGHKVVFHEPENEQTRKLLVNLVGNLPRGARWAGHHPVPPIDRAVVLPANVIDDETTVEILAQWFLTVSGSLRLSRSLARLLALAASAFADNGLRYGGPGGLLCACHDLQLHDLQLVALSELPPSGSRRRGHVARSGVTPPA